MNNTILNFCSSPKRHFIYSRWAIIVMLNALYPFILWSTSIGRISNIPALTGIMLAIISFVAIYAELESWLLRKHHVQLAKQLKIAASIRIVTVVVYLIDIFFGVIALEAAHLLTGVNLNRYSTYNLIPEITATYTTTMVVGFLSSILVGLLILIIRGITKLTRHYKQVTKTNTSKQRL